MCRKKKNQVGVQPDKVDSNRYEPESITLKKSIIFVSSKNGKLKSLQTNGKGIQNYGDIHNSRDITGIVICKSEHQYTGDSMGRVKRWTITEKGKQLKLLIDYGCIQGDIINSMDTNVGGLFISDASGNFKQISQDNHKEVYDFGQIHDGEIKRVSANDEFAFTCDNFGNLYQISIAELDIVNEYNSLCGKGINGIVVAQDFLWVTDKEGGLRYIKINDQFLYKDYIKIHDHEIVNICSNNVFVFTEDVTGLVKKFCAKNREFQADYGIVCKGRTHKMTCDSDYLVICNEEGEMKVFNCEDDKQLHKFNSGFGRSTSDIRISSFIL